MVIHFALSVWADSLNTAPAPIETPACTFQIATRTSEALLTQASIAAFQPSLFRHEWGCREFVP
uniref:Uncharacterized protein n=1 Tax=mine drainage metagenome TaxID=410659 RepID=E6PH36_9ZZZZ